MAKTHIHTYAQKFKYAPRTPKKKNIAVGINIPGSNCIIDWY